MVILPLFLAATGLQWNTKIDDMLTTKVSSDLKIADQYMAQLLLRSQRALVALTESVRFDQALKQETTSPGALDALLATQAQQRELDFLYLVDAQGGRVGSSSPASSAIQRVDWPVVASALKGGASVATDVFSARDLDAIDPALARRAQLPILGNRSADTLEGAEETRALVVHVAAPVRLPDGKAAALVGGMLLNGNLRFIDTIHDMVYRREALPEGSIGTASLFLDDLRISTNVHMTGRKRAMGTRASEVVRQAVLVEGKTWLNDAYVVNDWYVSGYEPIRDSFGKRVGMLYVGFKSQPFVHAKKSTLIATVLVFLLVATLTTPLFLHWARNIFKPLERIARTIERVESGNLGARTGQIDATDELGQLAAHLDKLLGQLEESDKRLRGWNEELNERVEERTRNLLLANQQLEATTKQLIMSEKLATIGEITAGVAHEINNPLAVMQGNLEVVRDLLGSQADTADVEFKLLDEQIHRISSIVTKLLQFSKPAEYAGHLDEQDPSEIVSDTLPLVQHILRKTSIVIEKQFSATRLVSVNKSEVQQVLVNLIVNAIHAMPDGGRLVLRTTDAESMTGDAGVAIQVADTGAGIAPDLLARIFDPFVSTKQQEGTGLGLSISQMLASRQGGTLTATSGLGKGSTFTLWLPESA
ncbi:cache domain-containing protein [Pseudoxanthomonas sp. 3HH-4]|uniref:sensor histidine kinase n=1 Tax=Pseudoxanthomonas sp. 3HH-4 TaxID=1690214 RepID=UPI001C89A66C|nr:cache domain-containing protein [Pseudoxanthomonas sp. 3HH-4]